MTPVFIYALTDPRTGDTRYVGKAKNPKARLVQHRQAKDGNRHKCNWLRQLAGAGLQPGLVVLEETTADRWVEREAYWIAQGRARGWPLTNILDSADARYNTIPTVDAALREYAGQKHMAALAALSADQKLDLARRAALIGVGHLRDTFACYRNTANATQSSDVARCYAETAAYVNRELSRY